MKTTEIKVRPWCPFCGQTVAKPMPPSERKLGEFTGGTCECGAVYTCDPTGHNVGSAMVEALVNACNDWDLAWELLPEDDYLTGRIENYDEQTDQVVETRQLDGRRVAGVIYFIRLHRDIAEISRRVKNKDTATSGSQQKRGLSSDSPPTHSDELAIEPDRDPKRQKRRTTKEEVELLVAQQDVNTLVDLCFDDMRTLRFMQRLLYKPEDHLRWRTIHVLSLVCARLATRKPGKVSDLLHRLFAACSDSAASSWGAIGAIGAIVAARSDIFGAFTRHLLKYLADQNLQTEVLWSMGTIAVQRPDLVRKTPFYNMLTFLSHPEPLYRGLAIRLFGNMAAQEAKQQIISLQDDQALFSFYEEGALVTTTVAKMADNALARIKTTEESGVR